MEPVNLAGTFGWLSPGYRRRGVILCGTLGFEQHVAHRWWRDLGEGIAATGCTVLRFDYPGEGDAPGCSPRLETALETLRRAIAIMRDDLRAEEIALVGLRLGGTLAATVAGEGGVDRLVLLAPFARGRAYLREMEMQARVIDTVPDGTPVPKPPGVLSVGGFRLEPDLMQALLSLDLRTAGPPPAPRILWLGPDPSGVSARYAAAGATVETGGLPDLSALLSDAEHPRLEETARARIVGFVAEGARPHAVAPPRPRGADAAITGPGWREDRLRFGAGLFGIRCGPPAPTPGTPTLLFVNMGVNVHSGYGRQTTTLARALAQSGVASLRMDLRGAGDSADRPGGDLPFYRHDAVADIRAAVDELIRLGAGPVIACGTCNGAYLAFHALCEDSRLAAAILVNLYCFDWALTHGGVAYGGSPVRHTAAYAAMLREGATWRRLLSGETPVVAILRALARRGIARMAARLGRRSAPHLRPLPIAARIAALRRRRAKLALLYSAGDLGLVDLRLHLGPPDRAGDILGARVHVLDGADHSFAAEPARDLLLRELRRMTAACAADHPPAAANDPSGRSLMDSDPQHSRGAA